MAASPTSSRGHAWRPPRAQGFTYLSVVLMMAVLGVAAVATLKVGAVMERRAAEQELLAIGNEFRDAFISYANATPPGKPRSPPSLEALLRDPRFPNLRRHLRRVYVDPLTGESDWGLVPAVPGPGVMGVYSLAAGQPIKIGNFELRNQDFEGKASYAEWKFMAPTEVISPPVGGAGAAPGAANPAAPGKSGTSTFNGSGSGNVIKRF